MPKRVAQHVPVDLKVRPEHFSESLDALRSHSYHEVDVVGGPRLPMKGARHAAADEVLAADGFQRGPDAKSYIQRVLNICLAAHLPTSHRPARHRRAARRKPARTSAP